MANPRNNERLRTATAWAAPIIAFYLLLACVWLVLAFVVKNCHVDADSYNLSTGNLLTVFTAPFTAGLSDATSNAEALPFFLTVLFVAVGLDRDFRERRRVRLYSCLVPVVSGPIAAALYLVPMHLSGLSHDGSGGSIIVAGMNGMLIVFLFAMFDNSWKTRRYVQSVLCIALLFAMVYEFRAGFLQAAVGNASAHLCGFVVGAIISASYVWLSRKRKYPLARRQTVPPPA